MVRESACRAAVRRAKLCRHGPVRTARNGVFCSPLARWRPVYGASPIRSVNSSIFSRPSSRAARSRSMTCCRSSSEARIRSRSPISRFQQCVARRQAEPCQHASSRPGLPRDRHRPSFGYGTNRPDLGTEARPPKQRSEASPGSPRRRGGLPARRTGRRGYGRSSGRPNLQLGRRGLVRRLEGGRHGA